MCASCSGDNATCFGCASSECAAACGCESVRDCGSGDGDAASIKRVAKGFGESSCADADKPAASSGWARYSRSKLSAGRAGAVCGGRATSPGRSFTGEKTSISASLSQSGASSLSGLRSRFRLAEHTGGDECCEEPWADLRSKQLPPPVQQLLEEVAWVVSRLCAIQAVAANPEESSSLLASCRGQACWLSATIQSQWKQGSLGPSTFTEGAVDGA